MSFASPNSIYTDISTLDHNIRENSYVVIVSVTLSGRIFQYERRNKLRYITWYNISQEILTKLA